MKEEANNEAEEEAEDQAKDEAKVSHILVHKVAKLTNEVARLEKELEKKNDLIQTFDRLFGIFSSTLDIHTKIRPEINTKQEVNRERTLRRNKL